MASVPQTEVHWHLWGRSRMGCCCGSSGSTCSPGQLGFILISPKPMPELAFCPPPMLASGANEAKASGLSKVELLRRVAPTAAPAPKRSCFSGVTRDRKYWRAQTTSGEYVGTLKSEKAAVAALANKCFARCVTSKASPDYRH